MTLCTSSSDGVLSRKGYRCAFCFEAIPKGTRYDRRTGVSPGDGWWTMGVTLFPGRRPGEKESRLWTMRMHPECHVYEREVLGPHDYEDMSEPSFPRADAVAFVARRQGMVCAQGAPSSLQAAAPSP